PVTSLSVALILHPGRVLIHLLRFILFLSLLGWRLASEKFTEQITDHRCGNGPPMSGFARSAFIECRKRVSGRVRGSESSKPRCGTFLLLRAPLRGSGFPRNLDVLEFCSTSCPIRNNRHHTFPQFFDRNGAKLENIFCPRIVYVDYFVVQSLDLPHDS